MTATTSATITLGEMNLFISGREAFGFQFQNSEVNASGNDLHFLPFEGGPFPPELRVQLGTQPPPAGFAKIWQGNMLLESDVRHVAIYRRVA